MLSLVLCYIAGVLVKQGWEASDWVLEHKGQGYRGWWSDQRAEVIKKAFMHVALCAGWVTGLLGNVMAGGMSALAEGATLGGAEAVTLPLTPATTIMAAFVLDSIGKPLMKRLKKKEAEG